MFSHVVMDAEVAEDVAGRGEGGGLDSRLDTQGT